MAKNYIFGYGSLIEDESRQRTTPTARYAFPVRVKGIRRGWWARGADSGLTTTYLGALKNPQKSCNGVIYEVSDEELQATDRRESAGYTRQRIPPEAITMLGGFAKPPAADYWAYINTFDPAHLDSQTPTGQFPIVQSYVDICVNGCLEVQSKYPEGAADFAEEFVATTEAWSRFWVNDRVYPRRPFIFVPGSSQIDTVLKTAAETRDLYYEIEISPASYEDRKPVRPKAKPVAPMGRERAACWEKGG